MHRDLQQRLTLAQKVLGVANMGLMPSMRLTREARLGLEEARQAGECMAPQAIEVLMAIENVGAVPGQKLCTQAMEQVGAVLRPILKESTANDQRARLDELEPDAPLDQPGQGG